MSTWPWKRAAVRPARRGAPRLWCGCGAAILAGLWCSACTPESLRLAIDAQRRADAVQQTVFDRQHEALRVLLYRDLLRRLESAGAALNDEQRRGVNEVWNDRDLVEFWCTQQERAKALRLAGVDAKLYSDQSVVDLLVKSLEATVGRAEQGIAEHAGKEAAGRAE